MPISRHFTTSQRAIRQPQVNVKASTPYCLQVGLEVCTVQTDRLDRQRGLFIGRPHNSNRDITVNPRGQHALSGWRLAGAGKLAAGGLLCTKTPPPPAWPGLPCSAGAAPINYHTPLVRLDGRQVRSHTIFKI